MFSIGIIVKTMVDPHSTPIDNLERVIEMVNSLADIRQNLKGLETTAAGPFREADGSRPSQCFKCRGWGHPKRLCPSQLNYTRGEWYRNLPPSQ